MTVFVQRCPLDKSLCGSVPAPPAPLNAFFFLFNWGSSGRSYWGGSACPMKCPFRFYFIGVANPPILFPTASYHINNPLQILLCHRSSRRQTQPPLKQILSHTSPNHFCLVCVFILRILRLFAAINPCNLRLPRSSGRWYWGNLRIDF